MSSSLALHVTLTDESPLRSNRELGQLLFRAVARGAHSKW